MSRLVIDDHPPADAGFFVPGRAMSNLMLPGPLLASHRSFLVVGFSAHLATRRGAIRARSRVRSRGGLA
ncbi:protein of unknown function [Agreia sp. COWG]|nr:protein of unknown function [Agreia sp. COWG]